MRVEDVLGGLSVSVGERTFDGLISSKISEIILFMSDSFFSLKSWEFEINI